jgi:aspartate racemase
LYHEILATMHDKFGVNVVVLGCTELSLAQEKAGDHPYQVIDAQSIIVDKTLALGRAFRESDAAGQALLKTMTD